MKIIDSELLTKFISSCPEYLDLTSAHHNELVQEKADSILAEYDSIEELKHLEEHLLTQPRDSLIFVLLALKIARSKLIVKHLKQKVKVSIVLAVYKEHNRIKKNAEHPHGEDFLRKKLAQMRWLTAQQPLVNWELIIVDDGCPAHSGEIAEKIISDEGLSDQIKVLYLAKAIEQDLPPAKGLVSTNESQKGGAIAYGLWEAAQSKSDFEHIILYTDADLSTHLGQVGLLIDPIINQDKSVAIGSRREHSSVVIKKGTRNNRGKLFIYLWKRLIPNLGEIIDTQCGFKAFKKEMVNEIINDLIERKFAFDIELLLKSVMKKENSIAKVPIAWIDSEAASTTTDLQPYLPMLKAIAKMYRRYFPSTKMADGFATFIESLDELKFQTLLQDIPTEITNREPSDFTKYNEVTAENLAQRL
jgi:glycosyltransferase involved in cell wall biosynthesis